jgi:hypothetical protein
MKTIYLNFFLVLSLTACAGKSGGSAAVQAQLPAPVGAPVGAAPVVTPPQPVAPTTVQLTLYADTVSTMLSERGVSYPFTMTGYCTVYESNTYCWDDGLKIPNPADQSEALDFWGEVMVNSETPTLWTPALDGAGTFQHTAQNVFDNGVASQVTCSILEQTLDCGTFTIDLNQVTQ